MDHWVCAAWPVRRQTYSYLPSRRASPPFGRYQIILLGEQRHMCVNNLPKIVTWQWLDSRVDPGTFRSPVSLITITPPTHTIPVGGGIKTTWKQNTAQNPQTCDSYERLAFLASLLLSWKTKEISYCGEGPPAVVLLTILPAPPGGPPPVLLIPCIPLPPALPPIIEPMAESELWIFNGDGWLLNGMLSAFSLKHPAQDNRATRNTVD